MSRSRSSSLPSSPPSDIHAIAALLGDAAQSLSALAEAASPASRLSATPTTNSIPSLDPLPAVNAMSCVRQDAAPKPSPASSVTAQERPSSLSEGETRTYYFPPVALQRERELLRRYRAEDVFGLLAEAHTLLAGLVRMMKSTHPDVRLKGHVIVSVGALLGQVVSLLAQMRTALGGVERVRSQRS